MLDFETVETPHEPEDGRLTPSLFPLRESVFSTGLNSDLFRRGLNFDQCLQGPEFSGF